eukprot:2862828-Pyramimonas_sp.AAC.1
MSWAKVDCSAPGRRKRNLEVGVYFPWVWPRPGSSVPPCKNLLGPCWAVWRPPGSLLGPSWAVLGAPWAVLGPSGTVLGGSGTVLGPPWGSLG